RRRRRAGRRALPEAKRGRLRHGQRPTDPHRAAAAGDRVLDRHGDGRGRARVTLTADGPSRGLRAVAGAFDALREETNNPGEHLERSLCAVNPGSPSIVVRQGTTTHRCVFAWSPKVAGV